MNFWNWFISKEKDYVEKIRQGIVFYSKPMKNRYRLEYKKPLFNRRLMSKRVFTHTRK